LLKKITRIEHFLDNFHSRTVHSDVIQSFNNEFY